MAPSGFTSRVDLTGRVTSDGIMLIPLPAAVTANGRVPLFACYLSPQGQNWLAVSHQPASGTDVPYCMLAGVGTTSGVSMALVRAPLNYFYVIVVVY